MSRKITRRSYLKGTVQFASAVLAGTAGLGLYRLWQRRSSKELYGPYPRQAMTADRLEATGKGLRPNIVLIYCDDLGYGDLGAYGSRSIKTPNIDRLAKKGMRLSNFYAANAVCAPSRAGLLTGRYPFRTGIIGNPYPHNEALSKRLARNFAVALGELGVIDLREKYIAEGLSPQEITLAEALRQAGYTTGMVGKWHLGDYSQKEKFNPLNHGFDFYFGVPHSNDMRPFPLYRNRTELEADLGDNQSRLTKRYTGEALAFLRRVLKKKQKNSQSDKPFFLYLAHTFPHQPLHASERFRNSSEAGKYGDAVAEIDWSTGQIMDFLARQGLDNGTLVIFTSDNGPWYEGSPGGLRGRKGQSYEGGFRVPFIVKWPGKIPANKVSHVPAVNLDLFPTLLHLAGVAKPPDRIIDGRDLWPIWSQGDQINTKNKIEQKFAKRAIYFYHYDQLQGVRLGKWKYFRRLHRYTWPIPLDSAAIPNSMGKDQLGRRWPLLYNLELDPGENYNVINKYPKIASRLRKILKQWQQKQQSNPRGFY